MNKLSSFYEKSLEDQLYIIGLIFLCLGGSLMVLYFGVLLPNIPTPRCIWLEWFGIYCPGCGGTRAVWLLFHGHLLQSLWYHPLVLYSFGIYGGFMLSHTLEKLHIPYIKGWKFHYWYLYGAIVVLVVNFVGRNLLKYFCGITL